MKPPHTCEGATFHMQHGPRQAPLALWRSVAASGRPLYLRMRTHISALFFRSVHERTNSKPRHICAPSADAFMPFVSGSNGAHPEIQDSCLPACGALVSVHCSDTHTQTRDSRATKMYQQREPTVVREDFFERCNVFCFFALVSVRLRTPLCSFSRSRTTNTQLRQAP